MFLLFLSHLGFKVNIYKNMGLEAEYGFRKTFYDNFDGLKDLVALLIMDGSIIMTGIHLQEWQLHGKSLIN